MYNNEREVKNMPENTVDKLNDLNKDFKNGYYDDALKKYGKRVSLVLPQSYDDSMTFFECINNFMHTLNGEIARAQSAEYTIGEQADATQKALTDIKGFEVNQNSVISVSVDESGNNYNINYTQLNGNKLQAGSIPKNPTDYITGIKLTNENGVYAFEYTTKDGKTHDLGAVEVPQDNPLVELKDRIIENDAKNYERHTLVETTAEGTENDVHSIYIAQKQTTDIEENASKNGLKISTVDQNGNENSRNIEIEQISSNAESVAKNTQNLNSEITRAITKENSIESRISNIISQSGNDNTEIVDARKEADVLGTTTFSTLGDAIRTQISALYNGLVHKHGYIANGDDPDTKKETGVYTYRKDDTTPNYWNKLPDPSKSGTCSLITFQIFDFSWSIQFAVYSDYGGAPYTNINTNDKLYCRIITNAGARAWTTYDKADRFIESFTNETAPNPNSITRAGIYEYQSNSTYATTNYFPVAGHIILINLPSFNNVFSLQIAYQSTFIPVTGNDTGAIYFRSINTESGTIGKWFSSNLNNTGNSILYNKKVVFCGDSFTHGDFTGLSNENPKIGTGRYANEMPVYPFFIGNETNCTVVNNAVNGMRLAGANDAGSFIHDYQSRIPDDADYLMIYFGINDDHQSVAIGDINSTDITTFMGAWNTIIEWIYRNRPNVHFGIVATNGADIKYANATKEIGKKWGVPVLDMNSTDHMLVIRSANPDVSSTAKNIALSKYRVSENNQHPNALCHKLQAGFIQSWLESL